VQNQASVQRKEGEAGVCGRFALFASGGELAERFRLDRTDALPAHFQISSSTSRGIQRLPLVIT
jgi:hypothetical protein